MKASFWMYLQYSPWVKWYNKSHLMRDFRDPVALGWPGGLLSIVLVWLTLVLVTVLVSIQCSLWESCSNAEGCGDLHCSWAMVRVRIYTLSLIPRSCQLDSCERTRMSSVWKWCWASDACCMMPLIGAWKNNLNSLPKLHVQTLRRNPPHMVCY